MDDIREKLLEHINYYTEHVPHEDGQTWEEAFAEYLIANGVTVQEQNEEGCPYCDIAKANDGVINTKLWVKDIETNRWTMAGKRLNFCPMCGRRLLEPPKEGE